MKDGSVQNIRMLPYGILGLATVAMVLILAGPVQAADLFDITATGGGISRSVSGSSVVDLINNAINAQDTFSVFQGTAFTADLNYAGVASAIQFSANANGTSATLSIPSANFTRTFSGATRSDTEQQLEDFLKTDATGVIADFYKAINGKSLVAVADGNPRSTTALAASDSYDLYSVMVARTKEEREHDKDLAGVAGFGAMVRYGSFSANDIHGTSASLPLTMPFRFSQRVGMNFEIPLNYQTMGGAHVFGSGFIVGVPIKIMKASRSSAWSWQITPFGGVTGSASEEMAAGGLISNFGGASVLARDFRRVTVSMGNLVTSNSGVPFSVGDFHFDPGVRQTILKNGGKVDFPFGRRWIVDGSIVFTNFTEPAALSHYNTFGGEAVYRALGRSSNERHSSRYFRVGIYSDQGSNYHSTQFQIGTAWKF